MPLTYERTNSVDEIYEEIKGLLIELDLEKVWKEYNHPSGEYFFDINHSFINKYLFEDNKISIGIYEDIFSDNVSDKITIEYYSKDKVSLREFMNIFRKKGLKSINDIEISEMDECFFWNFHLDKKEFLNNTKECLRPIISNYLDVMNEYLQLID